MTQKRRVRVSERDTLERFSRDGCCLGEGSALTLLSMSGPDRLRFAPTTQSQPILLLSDRFSCARGACDERKEKTKRVCHGAQSPPPDVHANAHTIARTLSTADDTGRAAAVGGLCSRRPCTSPDAAKGGRTWPVAAAIVARLSWCVPCAVPRCTCGNTTAAAHRAFHKQTGIGGTILSRATCQDSDKMMLAFSADRTTHFSLSRTAPLSRCIRRLQPCRLRPWQSPQSLPVSLCRAKTLALKGWHG